MAKQFWAEIRRPAAQRFVSVPLLHFEPLENGRSTKTKPRLTPKCLYSLILDNVGERAFSDMRRVLTPQGRILPDSGHGGMSYVVKAFLLAPFMRQQDKPLFATVNGQDMATLKELIEAGKVTPVIDRTYPFEEIPAALGYAAEGHARGKVVIAVA